MLMVFELLFLSYGKRLVRTDLSCTFQYEWLPSVSEKKQDYDNF